MKDEWVTQTPDSLWLTIVSHSSIVPHYCSGFYLSPFFASSVPFFLLSFFPYLLSVSLSFPICDTESTSQKLPLHHHRLFSNGCLSFLTLWLFFFSSSLLLSGFSVVPDSDRSSFGGCIMSHLLSAMWIWMHLLSQHVDILIDLFLIALWKAYFGSFYKCPSRGRVEVSCESEGTPKEPPRTPELFLFIFYFKVWGSFICHFTTWGCETKLNL